MKKKNIILLFICILCLLLLSGCSGQFSLKPIEDIFNGIGQGLSNFGNNISHMFDNFLRNIQAPR